MAYDNPFKSLTMSPEEQQALDYAKQGLSSNINKYGISPIVSALDYGAGLARGVPLELETRLGYGDKNAMDKYWSKALRGAAPSTRDVIPNSPWLLATAQDMAFDPLNFIGPAALLNIASKGAKVGKAAKAIDTVSDISKTFRPMDDIIKEERAIGKALSKSIVPETPGGFLPSQLSETVGVNLQYRPYKKIDRALQKEGATPISTIIRENKLSGGGTALEEGLEVLTKAKVKWNDQVFNLPQASGSMVSTKNIIPESVLTDLQNQIKRTGALDSNANVAFSKIEEFSKQLPEQISLQDARKYMSDFGDIVKDFNKFTPNSSMDKAVKKIASNMKKEVEKTVATTYGDDIAKQFSKNNKDLQSIISSTESIYDKTTGELTKPLISQVDSTMIGLLGGRLASGTPVAPIAGALVGKTLGTLATSKAMVGTGRAFEKLGVSARTGLTPTVGKILDTQALKIPLDIINQNIVEQEEADPFEKALQQRMVEQGLAKPGESFDDMLDRKIAEKQRG